MITPEEIKQIECLLESVPPSPWHFSPGDDFDHWELWSSHPTKGYCMIQDDGGVPPDSSFIDYILRSRQIIERLLEEVKQKI